VAAGGQLFSTQHCRRLSADVAVARSNTLTITKLATGYHGMPSFLKLRSMYKDQRMPKTVPRVRCELEGLRLQKDSEDELQPTSQWPEASNYLKSSLREMMTYRTWISR